MSSDTRTSRKRNKIYLLKDYGGSWIALNIYVSLLAAGRKLANSCGCKFIETSSGLDHNVDELLVGILAQVQLNPRRNREKICKKKKKQKVRIGSGQRMLRQLLGIKRKSRSCENLLIL
jgi:hypothetical protein